MTKNCDKLGNMYEYYEKSFIMSEQFSHENSGHESIPGEYQVCDTPPSKYST